MVPGYDGRMTVAAMSAEPPILVVHLDREKACILAVGSAAVALASLALLTNAIEPNGFTFSGSS
jgi:hypothetical protein